MGRPPDVEVIVLSESDWNRAVLSTMDEPGLTMEELERQAESGDFNSINARKLWLAIKPYQRPHP